jgi:ATP-binding cassette subfamily F protein 3
MIILENIALRRGQKLLFSSASATLQPGQKIALIGGNGSGKSSLFALLLGTLQADSGDIRGLAGLRISHMAQETERSDLSAREYVIAGDEALYDVLKALVSPTRQKTTRSRQRYINRWRSWMVTALTGEPSTCCWD